ncbi:MAG TPA: hypothetical protein VFQ01_01455 [Nocardioides sp.]|jgi:hypothetical protein|nr:hypothetical protein [Nocardioides sp.]
MSTILHPVQHHAWWYAAAAAAVATGLLVVLMAVVFNGSGSEVITPPPLGQVSHGHAYAPPCFMGRPGNPIELARSGCNA